MPARISVKQLRERLGLSGEAFAEEVGVSARSITRWEQGHFNPSPLAMARLRDLQRSLAAPDPPASGPRRVAVQGDTPSAAPPVVGPWRQR